MHAQHSTPNWPCLSPAPAEARVAVGVAARHGWQKATTANSDHTTTHNACTRTEGSRKESLRPVPEQLRTKVGVSAPQARGCTVDRGSPDCHPRLLNSEKVVAVLSTYHGCGCQCPVHCPSHEHTPEAHKHIAYVTTASWQPAPPGLPDKCTQSGSLLLLPCLPTSGA